MNFLFFSILFIYIIGILASPFPYWGTYRYLWGKVLRSRCKNIPLKTRLRNAILLTRYFLLAPVWTLLWHLDELFFAKYNHIKIKPVFIIGQPRCGTTLLHRTMASDFNTFYSARHYEWRFPFLVVLKPIEFFGLASKFKRIKYWPDNKAGKEAAKMHPNSLYDYEEDGIFYEERFLHHYFLFLRFPYPGTLDYFDSFKELPSPIKHKLLTIHNKVIKKISYVRGSGIYYLSKEVTSHNKIEDLIDIYPDAKFVVIVRPSAEYMGSLLALVRKSTQVKTGVDPIKIKGWESEVINNMQKNSELLVHLCTNIIDRDKQVRTTFDKLTSNIESTVSDIYSELGLEISDTFAELLRTQNKQQKKRKKGYVNEPVSLNGFEVYDQFVHAINEENKTLEPVTYSKPATK